MCGEKEACPYVPNVAYARGRIAYCGRKSDQVALDKVVSEQQGNKGLCSVCNPLYMPSMLVP